MGRWRWLFVVGAVAAIAAAWYVGRDGARAAESAAAAPAGGGSLKPGRVALRIQLGLRDEENTRWDGSIRVSPGTVANLEVWRKGAQDVAQGDSWTISSRPAPRFQGGVQKQQPKPSENGIVATLEGVTEESEVSVTTRQGAFAFKLSQAPFGTRLVRLEGNADVVRIPVSYQLTADATEEDYPSAAVGPDGTVWIAYVAFTHGKGFARRERFGDTEPDISGLDRPTGGDRVFVIRLRQGQWSAPLAVTPGGEDIYKTAIAVDGSGRPWVFWSVQQEGNFDLWASSLRGEAWSKPLRLTKDPGPDIAPAAARDAQGRVWVVWQGFRGDHSNILAARQEGDRFSSEMAVSDEPANDWEPAIATSAAGEVAVAWDTYARGNYDVCLRVAKEGEAFGPLVHVAASLRQEVHAAVAYDGAGRLWVAWEQGPEMWGKDFGALVKDQGAPLYGGGPRTVAVKCFVGGQPFQTAGGLPAALNPPPAAKPGPKAKPGAKSKPGAKAKAGAEAPRQPGRERPAQQGAPLSYPRLVADASGRVWLAYRARAPHFWCGVGTSWFEYLACYEAGQWQGPIYVHNSDNILDNRPAMVSLADGSVLLVGSSDGRQKVSGYQGALQKEAPKGAEVDPVNNDLYVSQLGLGSGKAAPPQLVATAPEAPAEPVGRAEPEAIARCRHYRIQLGGKTLRLMRGEFHRHTELSSDGGGDGALLDMYRYGLDAAGMDWIGNGDHDNNNGREYPWWITQKTADAYHLGEVFVPMFSYERSVTYPDGHRNPIFARRGVRTLPRFGKPGTGRDDQQPAHTPDTQLLYKYLARYDGLCASHTSATNMGTDWRDNDPKLEPVVEIYQGCRQNYEEPGAPRAPSEADAIGGWRPNGFVWNALAKGYRLGFQASSDHVSTHISYCILWAEAPTRQAMFDAMKRRHCYGATDNIIAEVRCGEHFMGDEFTLAGKPAFRVKLIGTDKFKQVDIVRNNKYVYTTRPDTQEVEFTWTDMAPVPGTSYYYVRGEQEDGELVWVSPMWITLK